MADRTNCSLTIYGRLTKEQHDAFKSACDDIGFVIYDCQFSQPVK